jgi:ATP-dependent DNA helicase PIF1
MAIDLKSILANHQAKSSGDPQVDELAKVRPWEKTPPEGSEGGMVAGEAEDNTLLDQLSDSLRLLGCEPPKPEAKPEPGTFGALTRDGADSGFFTSAIPEQSGDFSGVAASVERQLATETEQPLMIPHGYEKAVAELEAPAVIAKKFVAEDDEEFADYEANEITTSGDREVECQFITGPAGTGKTFTIKQRIEEDRNYGILCATTGIAGVNLGATTINAVLGYFDTESLNELFVNGRLTRKLAELSKQYKNIIVDEISMMDGAQLDTLKRAAQDVADNYTSVKHPIGIILTGDFCQLPPVKGKWAFDAQCWPDFEKNITRLTKYWRQTDEKFLNGINTIRSGDGRAGMEWLKQTPVQFVGGLDTKFDGTTIVAKNVQVDRVNFLSLQDVKGKDIKVMSKRWGRQRGEWKLIPDELHVKVGAYVMILANDSPHFTYANGDCGHIEEYDPTRLIFRIKLARNGNVVEVPHIVRTFEQSDEPADLPSKFDQWPSNQWYDAKKPFKVEKRRKYGIGQVFYPPIRLAYAATVHKTQGLSLDRIQMDVRDAFFGSPSMVYVALSRARTPEGLRIIGGVDTFVGRVKTAPEVLKWL